jgi:hypothetical protein
MPGPGDLDRHGFRNTGCEGPVVVGRNGGIDISPRHNYGDAVQQPGLALRADRLSSPNDEGTGDSNECSALLAVAQFRQSASWPTTGRDTKGNAVMARLVTAATIGSAPGNVAAARSA